MSFDLKTTKSSAQSAEIGHAFEPRYPGGELLGATITVRGARSAVVRAHARRRFEAAQARDLAAKKRGRDVEPMSLEEIEEALTEIAVAHTMAWQGIDSGGQPFECTPENARSLYTDHPWLREQVIAEAQDLGNFTKPSSTSSSITPGPNSI